LFPGAEEWKKWGEFTKLANSELTKREIVFRTTLVAEPLSYKCDGTMPMIMGLVGAGHGKVNALFSPAECGQKDAHYHLVLSTRGAELVKKIEPPIRQE
jgi:hypothetical protein